ncbi:MAG: Periplasmic trehalase [Chlamydiae bacterium]|nr:Periplasmic trehalase [Chlamydiota bacterium]
MAHQIVKILVDVHLKKLLKDEDLDRDLKITIEDKGPKNFLITTLDGDEIKIKGHYPLSNLLQFLAYVHQKHEKICELNVNDLYRSPLDQINCQINKHYWNALTRTFDEEGIVKLLEDPKREKFGRPVIYVPEQDQRAYNYYTEIASKHRYLKLKVTKLPLKKDKKLYKKLDEKPGLLALSSEANPLQGNPFVVPGGRFNEMYGWDSYFIIEGLLQSNRFELALSMLKHLLYQIEYYGKILNANRTYYLTRTQPPFLTTIIRLMLKHCKTHTWLERALNAVIKEYFFVWMSSTRSTVIGLNRYHGEGDKEPLEVEKDHFETAYRPYAQQSNQLVKDYRDAYLNGSINEPKLDDFFIHDRSMRESGHDTTYRLVNVSDDLAPVDLNSLLYKYETDIADIISNYFKGSFKDSNGNLHIAQSWIERATKRQKLVSKYLWNKEKGMFFDYNVKTNSQHVYESATTFYPLFSGLATAQQAQSLIKNALPLLEFGGGVAGSSKESRGEISQDRPLRQWDYPFGWAPHQMLIWRGCQSYGYSKIAQRLAYKWLYMISKEARDYNGTITEKYDVVSLSHKLAAEYGNVGNDFGFYPDGGFGWVNASYLIGQTILSDDQLQALKNLESPESYFA